MSVCPCRWGGGWSYELETPYPCKSRCWTATAGSPRKASGRSGCKQSPFAAHQQLKKIAEQNVLQEHPSPSLGSAPSCVVDQLRVCVGWGGCLYLPSKPTIPSQQHSVAVTHRHTGGPSSPEPLGLEVCVNVANSPLTQIRRAAAMQFRCSIAPLPLSYLRVPLCSPSALHA